MKYDWMDAYCLKKKDVTKDYQPAWEATRYFVGGKMFAMQGADKTGRPFFSMKLEPAFSDLMRQQYEEIVAGYYMNKMHWSSLYLDGNVPDEVVRDMLDRSYLTGIAALPKKLQKEILD